MNNGLSDTAQKPWKETSFWPGICARKWLCENIFGCAKMHLAPANRQNPVQDPNPRFHPKIPDPNDNRCGDMTTGSGFRVAPRRTYGKRRRDVAPLNVPTWERANTQWECTNPPPNALDTHPACRANYYWNRNRPTFTDESRPIKKLPISKGNSYGPGVDVGSTQLHSSSSNFIVGICFWRSSLIRFRSWCATWSMRAWTRPTLSISL